MKILNNFNENKLILKIIILDEKKISKIKIKT